MKKLLALALLLVACGATASSDLTDASNLPSKDGAAEASGDGGGVCCPADPGPGCCMKYGGWSGDGQCSGQVVCDGMPVPSDPGWKLVKDDHGCSMWSNASPGGSNTCGAPPKMDASTDAPAKG